MTAHSFEPDLNAPPPRRVGHRAGFGIGCGLWAIRIFILPHTIAGIVVLLAAFNGTGLYLRLWMFGSDYDGRVAKKVENRNSKGRVTYAVSYTYIVDGNEYAGQGTVAPERNHEVREGDALRVRALESSPSGDHWSRLPGSSPLLDVGGMWLFALFWNAILSVFVWAVYVMPWRKAQLVKRGVPTEGIIRDVETRVHKGTTSYHIKYDYAVPSLNEGVGGVLNGKMVTSNKEAVRAVVGQVVTVLYLPHKPWRSVVYQYADYRAK